MKSLFSSLLLAVVLLFTACQQATGPVVLHILHTNDTHSQIEPHVSADGLAEGGVVERSAMLEYWREQDPDLMYFDGGDMVQGSPYYNIFKGDVEIGAMNLQQLEATTFGNHEFDNGIEFLENMLKQADFPILSCNYDVSQTSLAPYVKRTMIIERKGVKIGLSGLTVSPKNLIFARNVRGIEYLDPVVQANQVAQELREQGCDLVVLLSHLGLVGEETHACDTVLARQLRNVDIIIGAHTHRNLENGIYVNDLDNHPVLITQTAGKGNPMGFIELTMVPFKGEHGQHYQLLVDSTKCSKLHPADYDLTGRGQAMAEYIQPWRDSLSQQMGTVLGTSAQLLDRGRPQSLLGNFTADALVEMGTRISGKPVDMAFMNIGGLRSNMPEGELNVGNLFSIYPFENTFCLLDVKGSDLLQVINSISGKGLEAISRDLHVDLTTVGTRVKAKKVTFRGRPIDPERTYRVATIDYLAEGNGGFAPFTRAQCENTQVLLRDVMIEYVKLLTAQGKTCDASFDNRVTKDGKMAY